MPVPNAERVNIGPAEPRKRRRLGTALLACAVAMAAVLLATGAARWWRGLLFLPLWGGLLGVAQAGARTCVILAARGTRNLDTGEAPIPDAALVRLLRRRAHRVHGFALLGAAGVTALLLLL